jgi:3-oxoacyl-[acyl-carrier protein] reductase
MDLGLSDRVFVVTGGSRGLGRATVEVLLAEGARVVAVARTPEPLRELADTHDADRVTALPADLADPSAAERIVATAVARYGRVDGALISVGGPPTGSPLTVTDDVWRTAFETAFLGPLRMARSLATAFGDDGGALLFVLSTSVRTPLSELATSNGLRPGLAMVAKQLADELGPRGVRVNGILPALIDTERVRALDAARGRAETVRKRQSEAIPLRRYGDPVEFASVAAFLLSPAASYVSGTMVTVDGGLTRSP